MSYRYLLWNRVFTFGGKYVILNKTHIKISLHIAILWVGRGKVRMEIGKWNTPCYNMYISIINSGYYYYQLFFASLFNLLLPLSWYPQLHNLGKVFIFLTLISFQASLPLSNFFPCQGLFVCILCLLLILFFALFHLKCTSWPLFLQQFSTRNTCLPTTVLGRECVGEHHTKWAWGTGR